jgi:hypothetical protein
LLSDVIVHPRVNRKHPEISNEDVIHAWTHAIGVINRTYNPPDYYAAAGVDTKGRMLELVGVELEDGGIIFFHAMKLTDKMRRELGL